MPHFLSLPFSNVPMTPTIPNSHPPPIPNPPMKPTPTLSLLPLCNHLHETKQLHALMIKTSQISDPYAASRLAEFYAISDNGSLQCSEKLVNSMEEPYTFAWNTLIRGNLKKKNTHKAISLMVQVLCKSVEPDCYTFTLVLKACTSLVLTETVRQLHCQIVKRGLENSEFIRNKLIHVYAVYGSMVDARKVFDGSPDMDIVTWNSMLEGYAENGDGELLHQVFDKMPQRDVVSWNTMIAYYVRVGEFVGAVEMFRRMQEERICLDGVTLVSVLTAVTQLGALAQGKWVHAYIRKHGIELDDNLGSALVNMYSKCGCVDGAIEAFDETKKKSLDTWNAMIGGLAANGQSLEAIDLFSKMERSNIQPDTITFSCILNACSHGGLVEDGLAYLNKMKPVHGIEPDMAHYGCVVDLLGRAGMFDMVEEIMKSMPMKPDAIMWKSLLGACKTHKNFELGEKAGLELIELAPDDHASYTLLSNLYAMANKWDQVPKLRKSMLEKGIKKPPGCSSIEVDGLVHEFIVGDTKHHRSKKIYDMVEEMEARLKVAGYEPDIRQVLLDIEEEEVKQTSLAHHSEKLAVAFGLISTRPGTTIRVIKNVRMCSDCHSVLKLLSVIYNRDLIIRDSNRFHHFKEGSCSCMDYW
ncbi:Pentatricopeptide repeat-containing protein [Actinidia chinensis var. chinensis]|uniref:Pentatricopeptide repeat-containing protein n=1 Tax=Actinidia chinensis var. chinensis TaxID=1590841 RepID=A0A2R6RFZ8_ACTCC|nr:Pentatricopeptide repeat-containing protein [Actinidia chinensis var. chinensis]